MSFRDIRNFTEMLRALGYPHILSLESFRTPNFPLVANLLAWLVKRFDPEIEVPLNIENEDDRVSLIKNVAHFMFTKANIKLNTKRLYQADGYAVKELLKVTALLYEALQVNAFDKHDTEDDRSSILFREFDISDKAHDVKQTRQLATEITASAANLFDLLGKEVNLRASRNISMGRQYEVNEVEAGIKKAIEALKAEISETQQLLENASTTEANLDAKIERRKMEIERYQKRLQTLNKVRPAFLEEFTALEGELEQLFVQYSSRMRCLNYLEKQAADAERAQIERQQLAASQRAVETIPLDRGEPAELMNIEEDMAELNPEEQSPKKERPRASTGVRSRDLKNELSMNLSSESDSDELLLDGDDSELQQSDDDSLGFDLSPAERRAPSGRKTTNPVQNSSDDDF